MTSPGAGSTAPQVARGLEGIVAAATRLSDVRGDIGQLIYCGYDINELAGKVSFEEVVHLLHHDHLPNRKELDELKGLLDAADEWRANAEDVGVEVADVVDAPNTYAVFVWGPERVKLEYVEHKPTFSLV